MKKIISLVLVFILVISFSVTALAAETHIYDYASLLSAEEVALLEEKAKAITEKYGCEVDIVTVYGMDGYSREDYDEKFIHDNDLGYGEDKSCVLLLVDMESRQFDIVAQGYGNIAFTDYGKAVIQDKFVGYLSAGVYHAAFDTFLDCSDSLLEMARNGNPYDTTPEYDDNYEPRQKGFSPIGLMIGAAIGFVIAIVICESFKSQMKTANIKTEANDYEASSGLKLTRRDDIFVNATFTRVKIRNDDDGFSHGGGGGGGTSINSGGFSHSGGSF